MSKTKGILTLVLVVLTVFFSFQYQNVMAADSRQGEIMNQILLIKVEYNSLDPLTITGTHNEGFFECSFTIENPSNYPITLLEIRSTYLRKKEPSLYIIAEGAYAGESKSLDPGKSTFKLKMHYTTYTELPPDTFTTPVFWVTISVKYGFSARSVSATVSDSTVTNEGAVARPESDETYPLLFTYSTMIMGTWILGIGAVLIAEFAKVEKTKVKVDQLAGSTFLLIALFIFCIFLLSWLPYPPPYRVSTFSIPASGGISGLQGLITIFLELIAALSVLTAVGLMFHQRWAKTLALITLVLSTPFLFSFLILYGLFTSIFAGNLGNLIYMACFVMVGTTTIIAIFNLTRSRDSLSPESPK